MSIFFVKDLSRLWSFLEFTSLKLSSFFFSECMRITFCQIKYFFVKELCSLLRLVETRDADSPVAVDHGKVGDQDCCGLGFHERFGVWVSIWRNFSWLWGRHPNYVFDKWFEGLMVQLIQSFWERWTCLSSVSWQRWDRDFRDSSALDRLPSISQNFLTVAVFHNFSVKPNVSFREIFKLF